MVRVWPRGATKDDKSVELIRVESWWLLNILPFYVRETVKRKASDHIS